MSTNYEWLDLIPPGWGELARKMIEECEAINLTYTIEDMKEKWGTLCIYSYCQNWFDNKSMDTYYKESETIENIERKYENISAKTCCKCGKSATKTSIGWVLPWCDECGTDEEKYYKRFEDEN